MLIKELLLVPVVNLHTGEVERHIIVRRADMDWLAAMLARDAQATKEETT